MKAVVRYEYCSPDLLELRDVEPPSVADDEVLVEVRAAGVDQGVWHLVTGLPGAIRLAGFGLRRPKQPVVGMDLAGVVTAVGAGVTRFRAGDEVFGTGQGSFAEYASVPAARLAHKPANVSFVEAAAVANSALAALQASATRGGSRRAGDCW